MKADNDYRSEEVIRDWLVSSISEITKLRPNQIDIRQSFDQYGMDSLQAVCLSGDLADWLREEVSPTVVWDYPTVELLARHLADRRNGHQPPDTAVDETW